MRSATRRGLQLVLLVLVATVVAGSAGAGSADRPIVSGTTVDGGAVPAPAPNDRPSEPILLALCSPASCTETCLDYLYAGGKCTPSGVCLCYRDTLSGTAPSAER